MRHVKRTEDGEFACRHCGRAYGDEAAAAEHVDALARAGMLQDHILIHRTSTDPAPPTDFERRARSSPLRLPAARSGADDEDDDLREPGRVPWWVEAFLRGRGP